MDSGWPRSGPRAPFVLAVILSAGAVFAAAPGIAGEPWHQDRFLIGGWGVNELQRQPAGFLLLAQAGLDFVHDNDHGWQWASERSLSAEFESLWVERPDFRMRAILHHRGPASDEGLFTANPQAIARWSSVRRSLIAGGGVGRVATLGWFVWDEPCDRASLRTAADIVRQMRADPATADHLALVNLLPSPEIGVPSCLRKDWPDPDPATCWTNYADTYLSAFDADSLPAPCLSFDQYPFQDDGRMDAGFLRTLRCGRDLVARHGRPGAPIPLWIIIQLAPYKPRGRPMMQGPTIPQVRWQAWCALAYGARSISYWTTGTAQDSTRDERFGMGLLDLHGRPTPRYEPIRELNLELHAIGRQLYPLEPVATLVSEAGDQDVAPDELLTRADRPCHVVDGLDPSGDTKDCLIGYFKDRAREADELLVVNRSTSSSRSFTLRLDAAPDSVERFDSSSGRFVTLDGVRSALVALPSIGPSSALLLRVVSPIYEHIPGVQRILRHGQTYDYVLARGVWSVNEATGARAWVSQATGVAATDRRATASGVVRLSAGP